MVCTVLECFKKINSDIHYFGDFVNNIKETMDPWDLNLWFRLLGDDHEEHQKVFLYNLGKTVYPYSVLRNK